MHAEVSPHLDHVLQQIKDLGARAAVAINPSTPADVLAPVLGDLDMALVMTVNPGYAGQPFIASALPKVRQIRGWIAERGTLIDLQVDGGINDATAPQAVAAGADVLVAATGGDNTNAVVAQVATKGYGVRSVAARIFDYYFHQRYVSEPEGSP